MCVCVCVCENTGKRSKSASDSVHSVDSNCTQIYSNGKMFAVAKDMLVMFRSLNCWRLTLWG